MFASSLVAATLLPVTASARDDHDFSEQARKRVPFTYAVANYIPIVGRGSSASLGTDFWASCRLPVGSFDFRINSHGQSFSFTEDGGDSSLITVESTGVDVLYRMHAIYAGPGMSLVSQTANSFFFPFSKPSQAVFGLTAGYDVTKRVFVEAEWQALGEDPYRHASVSLGYRF